MILGPQTALRSYRQTDALPGTCIVICLPSADLWKIHGPSYPAPTFIWVTRPGPSLLGVRTPLENLRDQRSQQSMVGEHALLSAVSSQLIKRTGGWPRILPSQIWLCSPSGRDPKGLVSGWGTLKGQVHNTAKSLDLQLELWDTRRLPTWI